ncbi:MAG: hypothetical protein PHS42_06210, partial [Sulfurimonas sp.]|nr:hypothetical protein [Sulfurimonas sp.]MDD3835050.1 hypothetical protein [Sulfurimonas sp.]
SKVTSIKKAFGHFMLKYCYRKYLFLNCPNSNDMGVRILRYMHNIDGFNLIARKKGVKSWIKMIESYKILQKLKELYIDFF